MVAVATNSSNNPWRVKSDTEFERVEQWRPPDFSSPLSAPERDSTESAHDGDQTRAGDPVDSTPLPTLEKIEAIQQQAYEEGHEQGRKEGFDFGHREALEEGRKQVIEKLKQLDALFSMLDNPFKELDDQVERDLLTLVVVMVRQLVRREVRTDPNHIVGVMREALAILPVNSRGVRIMLHPEDAEIVRELYNMAETEQGWQIVEDPVVQRGGCRIVTETSQVDATLESRLHNLIAPLLGGLRSEDQAAGEEG